MGRSRFIFLLITGVITLCLLTAWTGLMFRGSSGSDVFRGVLYGSPMLDGRFKIVKVNGGRVYLPRYEGPVQGDFVEIALHTCDYDPEYNSYFECDFRVIPDKENQFIKWIAGFRKNIIDKAKRNLLSPNDYLVLAMTIGYEDDLPESLTEELRSIGAIHMLVVSGYNVSLILNFSGIILLRFPRLIYLIGSILLLVFFILITGFSPPIIRAVIMGTFVVVSRAFDRQATSLYLLILSGLLMVSWNPAYLNNVSFQLSFMATLGIIIFPFLYKPESSLMAEFFSSVGASLFVLPVISYYFEIVNILTVVSNVMLGWMVPFITYLGFVSYAVDNIVVEVILVVITDLFLAISGFLAGFNRFNIEYKISLKELTIYYLLLSMLLFFLYKVKLDLFSVSGGKDE